MTLALKYKLEAGPHGDVVLGKSRQVPRGMAINMLPSSRLPNAVALLSKVLESETEDSASRRLAAINLWRMNSPEAHSELLKAASTVKDPVALTGVVKCLGRVGDQRALQAIATATLSAKGVLASQGAFAATLIAHRLGLPGHDLPVPTDYVPMPVQQRRPMRFSTPMAEEAALCVTCLADEPYGIEIDPEAMQTFTCPGGRWMVVFNRAATQPGAVKVFQQRKTLLGILAAKHSEDGRYGASYLILTVPDAGESTVTLFVTRLTGEVAWAGSAAPAASGDAAFHLRTVGRIGVVPMELSGVIRANGAIAIQSATTAMRVLEKRRPRPLE